MKPLTPLIISVVVLTLVLIGYAGLRIVVADKSVAVASLTSQIQQKSDAASRVAVARVALAELASDETIVRGHFVPQTNVVNFINDLQDRGSTLGTTVDITSVAATNSKLRPMLQLVIGIRGTFDAVLRSLGSIEYAPYDLSVTGLSLTLDTKGAWVASVNISVGSTPMSAATSTSPS